MQKSLTLVDAVKMEHKLLPILNRITQDGWYLDTAATQSLISRLDNRLDEINKEFLPLCPPIIKPVGNAVSKPFKKDGTYSSQSVDWFGDEVSCVQGQFTRIKFEELSMSSQEQLKSFLLSIGWKPDSFTEKGSPQITESSLESLDLPEAKLIAERSMIGHRKSLAEGWLRNVRDDGRVPMVFAGVTATYRARHNVIANVPKVGTPYGSELRACLAVPEGKVLVGCDVKSAQLRMLAHYMDDAKFTEACVEGDLHQFNADLLKISRDSAKGFIYSLLFGAQPPKIATTLNITVREARSLIEQYLSSLPKLAKLKRDLTRAVQSRGYFKGLDGRYIHVDQERLFLNYLLQSAEAIHMRTAICFFDKMVKARKLDVKMVGWYHDETQSETFPEIAEEVGELKVKAIVKAGEYLNLRVPMGGDPKIGVNWKDTH